MNRAVSLPQPPKQTAFCFFDESYLEEKAGYQVVRNTGGNSLSPLRKHVSGRMPTPFNRDGRATDGTWKKMIAPGQLHRQNDELISPQ